MSVNPHASDLAGKLPQMRDWRPRTPIDAGLGIDRGHYIALRTADPAAAASFAVDHMGLSLVHTDGAGRHYLAGHGLDAYVLVYTPGEEGVDHASLLVRSPADLERARGRLEALGIAVERVEASDLWRHAPALRFQHSTGMMLELTTGVRVDTTMAAVVPAPRAVPAPISQDHVIARAVDVPAAAEFNTVVLGLKVSGSIVAPDGIPVLDFYRSHTLYHCFGTARSDRDGLHHFQLTLKNDLALYAACEQMRERGEVEILWGPVRHAAGQNVAFYFHDHAGNVVEFSAEEELIVCEDAYETDPWPVEDPRAADEWGSVAPESLRS